MLGPLIAGGLLLVLAWEHLLQLSLIPALVAAVFVWMALRGIAGQAGVSSVGAYFSAVSGLFQSRTLMVLLLLAGARSISQFTMVTFVPIYLREDLEFSTIIVGVYVSLLQVVGIATHPIIGYLSDRFSRKTVLIPGLVAFGLLCVALAFAAPGVPLVLTIVAIGAFIFTFHHIFIAAAMDITAEKVHGSVVALVYASSFSIGALGPVIGGVLADAYDVKATFIFAGSMAIAAGVLLVALRLPRVRPLAAT